MRRLHNRVATLFRRQRLGEVGEAEARADLAKRGLPHDARCTHCTAQLPLGGRFCTTCGEPGVVYVRTDRSAPGSNPGHTPPAECKIDVDAAAQPLDPD